MTGSAKRGGTREGAGRKPKSATGELMKTRQVRMTDQQWEDLKMVTADAMRAWVTKQARNLRGDSGGRMCSVTMSSTATGAKCASSCVGGCSTAGTGCVSGSPPQPGAETRSSCAVMRPSNGRAGAVGSLGTGGDQ